MGDLSLVIPCFNEADNLNNLFNKLDSIYKLKQEVEIVLVDNGSEDRTSFLIQQKLSKRKHFVKLVKIKKNIGYGHGILEGIKSSNCDVIAWTHSDLQTDPTDVIKAFHVFKKHPNYPNCILKGRRIGRNPIDALFTYGMSILAVLRYLSKIGHFHDQIRNHSKVTFYLTLARKVDRNGI